MKHIKNFEDWRAEQLAKVFLCRFNDLILKKSNQIGLDFIVGVKYNNTIDEIFGIEIKAGKKRSWFTKQIRNNKTKYADNKFPVLLFLFDMETDKGYFSWIVKPLSKPTFTKKFKFYQLNDKRMAGLIGFIECWHFENKQTFYEPLIKENWANIDNKSLKARDRLYFSCTESWEVDTLREKILNKYPEYTSEEINNSIKSCCKSEKAPFKRIEFEKCVIKKLGAFKNQKSSRS